MPDSSEAIVTAPMGFEKQFETEVGFPFSGDRDLTVPAPRIRAKKAPKTGSPVLRTRDPGAFLVVDTSQHPSHPHELPASSPDPNWQDRNESVYLSGGHSYDRKTMRRRVRRARKATTVYYHYPIKASGCVFRPSIRRRMRTMLVFSALTIVFRRSLGSNSTKLCLKRQLCVYMLW